MTTPTSIDESQFLKTSTSNQNLFETSNLKNKTYDDDDDDFNSGSHDDQLNNVHHLITFDPQQDNLEDPRAYSHKSPHFRLVKALYK